MNNTEAKDLALAQIRVALHEIAPEIPDDEIVPDAQLRTELRLDEVSIWALVTNAEMLSKKHVADSQIPQLLTVADLIELIADEPRHVPEEETRDVASAAADLASLFNQR
ncbi:hypothetical protein JTE88_03555 [Arcanobacterium phocisimile]|uniref:Carrier domain-containing protein n=1 Tax=Arcanobacterium phocisimile TaxID=1302235 RepID=A0ABX7ILW8_9ACTO|nr:hypothetical protein [Arcanobacterium phocisimile]QRV02813.1 hypothetical protein JTE88_03555 [Arcanobacterium phocisimile]